MSSILDNLLLDWKKSKQKFIWMNCLIAFSGGQDSINLIILWKILARPPSFRASAGLLPAAARDEGADRPMRPLAGSPEGLGDLGPSAREARPSPAPSELASGLTACTLPPKGAPLIRVNKPSILWCNHIWKTTDFYLFRHSFQISFLLNQRFFYTIFFSKYFSEKKARKFRYFSFLRIARYSGYDSVLTAHTQSDSIETFFINLFRGSGRFGLQNLRNFQIFLNYECSQTFY